MMKRATNRHQPATLFEYPVPLFVIDLFEDEPDPVMPAVPRDDRIRGADDGLRVRLPAARIA